jgi:predicted nucleic acid-binding protein
LQETLAALDKGRRHGVRGGHIHDFLHVAAARKAGADKIYTLNLDDFRGLRARIEIAVPPEL